MLWRSALNFMYLHVKHEGLIEPIIGTFALWQAWPNKSYPCVPKRCFTQDSIQLSISNAAPSKEPQGRGIAWTAKTQNVPVWLNRGCQCIVFDIQPTLTICQKEMHCLQWMAAVATWDIRLASSTVVIQPFETISLHCYWWYVSTRNASFSHCGAEYRKRYLTDWFWKVSFLTCF